MRGRAYLHLQEIVELLYKNGSCLQQLRERETHIIESNGGMHVKSALTFAGSMVRKGLFSLQAQKGIRLTYATHIC